MGRRLLIVGVAQHLQPFCAHVHVHVSLFRQVTDTALSFFRSWIQTPWMHLCVAYSHLPATNTLSTRYIAASLSLQRHQRTRPIALVVLLNHMAPTASEEDYDPSEAPAAAVMTHILQKSYQTGAVLGTVFIAPGSAAWQLYKYKQPLDALTFAGTAGRTVAVVFGALAAIGAARVGTLDRDGLEDRAYRLHWNKGQNRTDRFAQVGVLGGLAAGALLFGGAAGVTAWQYLGSASVGVSLGMLAHVITSPKDDE